MSPEDDPVGSLQIRLGRDYLSWNVCLPFKCLYMFVVYIRQSLQLLRSDFLFLVEQQY